GQGVELDVGREASEVAEKRRGDRKGGHVVFSSGPRPGKRGEPRYLHWSSCSPRNSGKRRQRAASRQGRQTDGRQCSRAYWEVVRKLVRVLPKIFLGPVGDLGFPVLMLDPKSKL